MDFDNGHQRHHSPTEKTGERGRAGIWIDHRKAVVVIVSNNRNEFKVIPSNVDKQPGRYDGVRSTVPFEAQQKTSDGSRDRDFTGHLNTYYDEVIASISSVDSIFIFGPGEAKGELVKRLEKALVRGHIDGVETADKMTEHQIVAKVRQHYLPAKEDDKSSPVALSSTT